MLVEKKLQFRADGTFKVVQFTDLHWQEGDETDMQTKQTMERVLDAEQPDFVMITGDVIYSNNTKEGKPTCEDPLRSLRHAVAPIIDREIPWALVFGNHDTEQNITRHQLMDEAIRLPFSYCEAGPSSVDGVGNYIIPVKSKDAEEIAALLYALDSGEYSDHSLVKGYAWIKPSQLQWYVEQSKQWQETMDGRILPALAFFHIPLPEYDSVWNEATCYGQKHEKVCAAQLNSGFFTAMLERGDVIATFCGHDHVNDYRGQYYGIELCYGRATGYSTYGRDDMTRGARVILLQEGSRELQSWLRLGDGSLIEQQPVHLPEQ